MKLSRFFCMLPLAAAVAGCDRSTTGARVRAPGELAPLLSASAEAVPGRYVVVMNAAETGTAAVAHDVVAAHGGTLHFTYRSVLNGFAASLSPAAVDELRRDPRVRYVAQDAMAHPDSVQWGASWGLDRIDQRNLPLGNTYTSSRTGQGVRVYVIDTGIRTTHAEFGGRATVGIDYVGDGQNGQDCNGHGTHVAGTVAGTYSGVAKAAQVVSVRVFGCSGGAPFSTIIAAVEWVTANAQKPAVANMSLSGSAYAPMNEAVRASIASGVVYAVAAGNENGDACTRSPAGTPEALTVGATASNDARSVFSNWGTCVDLFAPGTSITSALHYNDNYLATLSGTSMASPHVAGVAALYLQGNPTATPATVAARILATSTARRLQGVGTGSPNRLLFSRLTEEGPGAGIVLNPVALALTFVRPVAGMAVAADAPADAGPAQVFQATGQGEGKTAADGAGTAATATATVLSSPVLLINAGAATLEWDAAGDRPWLSVSPGNGTLTSGSLAGLTAVVDASALSPGTHTGRLTVSDAAGVNTPAQVNVTVGVAQAQELVLDTPRTGLAGSYGIEAYYAVSVPAGAATLSIGTSGGTGDIDLFVRYGEAPSSSRFDCQSWSSGNAESCVLPSPRAGTYYVMVRGWSAYSGVTLHATGGGPPAAPSAVVLRPLTTASLRLSWADSVANETGFTVSRRSEPSPGTWTAWADAGKTAANVVRFTQAASAGVNYQYRVRACNAAGCSAWVASATARIPTSPPSAPFGLSAAAAGATRAALTWTDGSVDEASFSVTRSLRGGDGSWGPFEAAGSAPAGVTSFTSAGLLGGGTYRFQVNACNVVGCSGWATSGAVVLPTVPAAPTGLSGNVVSSTSIQLSWTDASSNEASFQLTRALVGSTGTVGEYVEVATLPPNRTSFTSTGLVPGTTYRFRVRACNLAGCAARAISPNVSIPPVPGSPMAFTASSSPGAIRLTWTDGSGETSYLLSRSLRNPDGTWGAWSSPVSHPANTARVDDAGLLAGRMYRYQLRACNVSGCSQRVTAVAATPAS